MPLDALPSDIAETGYPAEKLYLLARECRASKVVLILDACRSLIGGKGDTGEGSKFGADLKRLTMEGMGDVSSKAIITIRSCSPEEVSWDMPEKSQSVFSYYFEESLATGSQRKLSELSAYLAEKVPAWVLKEGKPTSQTPNVEASAPQWEDFPLLPGGAIKPPSPDVPVPVRPSEAVTVTPAIAQAYVVRPMDRLGDFATRYEIAAAIVDTFRMSDSSASADTSPWSDVPTGHWALKAINTLQRAGVLIGYPDGTFAGKGTMTRAEWAVLLTRVLPMLHGQGTIPPLVGQFEDLSTDHWAYDSIRCLGQVFQGYVPTFRCNERLRRSEMEQHLKKLVEFVNAPAGGNK